METAFGTPGSHGRHFLRFPRLDADAKAAGSLPDAGLLRVFVLSVYLYLSVDLPIYPSIYLSACLSVNPSIYLSIHLSLSVYRSIYIMDSEKRFSGLPSMQRAQNP